MVRIRSFTRGCSIICTHRDAGERAVLLLLGRRGGRIGGGRCGDGRGGSGAEESSVPSCGIEKPRRVVRTVWRPRGKTRNVSRSISRQRGSNASPSFAPSLSNSISQGKEISKTRDYRLCLPLVHRERSRAGTSPAQPRPGYLLPGFDGSIADAQHARPPIESQMQMAFILLQ